MELEPFYYKKN